MKTLLHFFKRSLIAVSFCLLIISCSKLTQSNYEKIKPNMNIQDVITILGEPTSSESINVAGISGTSAVWKDSSTEIDIQFLNDKLTVKTFGKPGSQTPQEVPPPNEQLKQ